MLKAVLVTGEMWGWGQEVLGRLYGGIEQGLKEGESEQWVIGVQSNRQK